MAKLRFKDFRAVINLWTTRETLAHRLTLPSNTVRQWAHSNNIPPHYWRALCAVSKGRVTIDHLLDLAERRAVRRPRINTEPRRPQQSDFASH